MTRQKPKQTQKLTSGRPGCRCHDAARDTKRKTQLHAQILMQAERKKVANEFTQNMNIREVSALAPRRGRSLAARLGGSSVSVVSRPLAGTETETGTTGRDAPESEAWEELSARVKVRRSNAMSNSNGRAVGAALGSLTDQETHETI